MAVDHVTLMDDVYRRQRHIYDFTRKYYLFGRDRLISDLALGPGDSLVEIGCGTARNLIQIARLYPGAELYGLDASAEMLRTAVRAIDRACLSHRITLAHGLAEDLTPALFGREHFSHALFSYSLSMIPDWKQALSAAQTAVGRTGRVHIVDFGDLCGLGRAGRALMTAWLSLFHVSPRVEILRKLELGEQFFEIRDKKLLVMPGRYAFIWQGTGGSASTLTV